MCSDLMWFRKTEKPWRTCTSFAILYPMKEVLKSAGREVLKFALAAGIGAGAAEFTHHHVGEQTNKIDVKTHDIREQIIRIIPQEKPMDESLTF